MENNVPKTVDDSILKQAITFFLVCGVAVLAFDVGVYLFAPTSLTAALPGYKKPMVPGGNARPGNAFYPQNYFVADDLTGFDIGPNRRAEHYVPEFGTYPVWSNRIGCFDNEIAAGTDFEKSIYLAGDSFTWGYAPYEAKFGTLLKESSNVPVLSCGVSHSGQQHQFIKFKRNAKDLEVHPAVVVVNMSYNDIENDYTFPHTTVIDGWQVDTVRLDGAGNLVPRQIDQIKREMTEIMADARNPSLKYRIRRFVGHYSASAQIVNAMKQRLDARFIAERPQSIDEAEHIYTLFRGAAAHQFGTRFADRNKEALLKWRQDAAAHNYRLIIALIPPARQVLDQNYYGELRKFLTANQFEYYEFSRHPAVMDNTDAALAYYWQFDPHFNVEGNAAYAEFLADSIGLGAGRE